MRSGEITLKSKAISGKQLTRRPDVRRARELKRKKKKRRMGNQRSLTADVKRQAVSQPARQPASQPEELNIPEEEKVICKNNTQRVRTAWLKRRDKKMQKVTHSAKNWEGYS